jgi:small-conductance mechanosensitive channel
MNFFSPDTLSHQVISALLIAGGGLLLFYIIFFALKKWSSNKKYFLPGIISSNLHLPGLLLFIGIILTIDLNIFAVYFDKIALANIRHGIKILLIVLTGFFLVRTVSFIREFLIAIYARREYKDFTLRSVKTKSLLIQRIANVIIIITTFSILLMTFRQVKEIGSALLASAGVAGIVLGFAAQKSLGTLFAGIQIAISQPVRIDDTVVVEGQFGTIGEITLTYVVVNTWDGKRLIVPISYFLEKSFENWTRKTPEVIGKVRIYTDYTLPVEEVRKACMQWVQESPLWDKRKSGFLVTNADNKTIEVRATMSAKDPDDAFDLECYIREKLITFIQQNYPQCLPTARLKINEETHQDSGMLINR